MDHTVKTAIRAKNMAMRMDPKKSPNVWMAMTAPGTVPLCGTTPRKTGSLCSQIR